MAIHYKKTVQFSTLATIDCIIICRFEMEHCCHNYPTYRHCDHDIDINGYHFLLSSGRSIIRFVFKEVFHTHIESHFLYWSPKQNQHWLCSCHITYLQEHFRMTLDKTMLHRIFIWILCNAGLLWLLVSISDQNFDYDTSTHVFIRVSDVVPIPRMVFSFIAKPFAATNDTAMIIFCTYTFMFAQPYFTYFYIVSVSLLVVMLLG